MRRRLSKSASALRRLCLCLLMAAATSTAAAQATRPADAAARKGPPNIVVLLVDDMGWADWGGGGSTFYETPNLDKLAARGVTFTNAYANCPVCSPSRAALLTGRYPQRSGVTDYIGAPQPKDWKRETRLNPAPYAEQLPPSEKTLAEILKPRGYATFFAGKWHLGPEGDWPEDRGFDVNKGGIDRGGPYGGDKYFSPYGNPRLEDGPKGEHLPHRLAAETVKFMDEHKDGPFLAYLSFYSVHTPLMARADLKRKYDAKRRAFYGEKPGDPSRPQDHPQEMGELEGGVWRQQQAHATYAGMIEAMDEACGDVLDALDRLGIADNTIVLFTSDNGGLSTAEGSPTTNLPLRAGKGWMYEGGIREPLIVRWPGVTKAGGKSDTVFGGIDALPTLLAAAGLADAIPKNVDGLDLTAALRGEDVKRPPLFWQYPHYGNQRGTPAAAVRDGKWKLIQWYEGDRFELFDLEADIGESSNVLDANPEVAARLKGELAAWIKAVGAKLPTPAGDAQASQ